MNRNVLLIAVSWVRMLMTLILALVVIWQTWELHHQNKTLGQAAEMLDRMHTLVQKADQAVITANEAMQNLKRRCLEQQRQL